MRTCRSIWFFVLILAAPALARDLPVILHSPAAAPLERLAAVEIRRYFYMRTGELLEIEAVGELPGGDDAIVVGIFDRPLLANLLTVETNLVSQGYLLKTVERDGRRALLIAGGDPVGALYGAYCFAEHLGVSFDLHGDAVPERRVKAALPDIDQVREPLFDLRGIHPFHDFPEGPDWWSLDDYKAVLAQLPKLGMNFFALHTYPERIRGIPYPGDHDAGWWDAEPTVWIGLREDVRENGTVTFSYPASYHSTARPNWGYAERSTGEFLFGARLLFERDAYGSPVQGKWFPRPVSLAQCNAVFDNTAALLDGAFSFARRLGIRTCIGTEMPLTVPEQLKGRLKAAGMEPDDPEVILELYRGMFTRIQRCHPLDYYWLWTPENWTWSGVGEEEVARTEEDLRLAVHAASETGAPFTLATCGWVLGPPGDRTRFDRLLPRDMPFSCINRQVGFAPVEPEFANLQDRPKWAIPWLEDDPALISPQLWAGRMRRDAYDALRYGCSGLMGIHWRTRAIGPNVCALARAGWSQQPWTEGALDEKMRDMPCADFYSEWARAQFGPEASREIAAIFTELDGGPIYESGPRRANLMRTSDWVKGPGAVRIMTESWEEIEPRFGFIGELEALRPRLSGRGALARFDYWLNTFRFARSTARLGSVLGRLDRTMTELSNFDDEQVRARRAAQEALPLRMEAQTCWSDMVTQLLAIVSTPGELGTVANLEQHNYQALQRLTGHDQDLEQMLGSLPAELRSPSTGYTGSTRLILLTRRTLLQRDEDLRVKAIVLSKNGPKNPRLRWRPFGQVDYDDVPLRHVGRGVYETVLSAAATRNRDFEYYIELTDRGGDIFCAPATAPEIGETVVFFPER